VQQKDDTLLENELELLKKQLVEATHKYEEQF